MTKKREDVAVKDEPGRETMGNEWQDMKNNILSVLFGDGHDGEVGEGSDDGSEAPRKVGMHDEDTDVIMRLVNSVESLAERVDRLEKMAWPSQKEAAPIKNTDIDIDDYVGGIAAQIRFAAPDRARQILRQALIRAWDREHLYP